MTRYYRISPENLFPEAFEAAVQAIERGELVAFPTETVYGLGADGLNPRGVERIFRAKGRPGDNPLILHVAAVERAEEVALVDSRAQELFRNFAPGPLTLVLPARKHVPSITRGGLSTVGVRIPSSPIALELLRRSPVPLAAPSANSSGRPSPTDLQTVLNDLGESVSVALDGGPTTVGLESTVLDVSTPTPVLLRPGGVSLEELRNLLPQVVLPEGEGQLRKSPGTRYRHYAPRVPLYLWEPSQGANFFDRFQHRGLSVGYMGLAPCPVQDTLEILFQNPQHYGRELYRTLRFLEERVQVIVAEMPLESAFGRALADRLRRAAGEEGPKGRVK